MKTEPTALAAGISKTMVVYVRPEASAYGSHKINVSPTLQEGE